MGPKAITEGEKFESEGGGYNQVRSGRRTVGPIGRRWHASMCVRRWHGWRWSGSQDRLVGTRVGLVAISDRGLTGKIRGQFDTLYIIRNGGVRNARNQ